MTKSFTTQAIADLLAGRLIGDGGVTVRRLRHPADVRRTDDLALAADPKLLPILARSPARAAVVSDAPGLDVGQLDACIVVSRPRLALARLTALFEEPVTLPAKIHPTAVIEDGTELGPDVAVGAFVYVGARARIGARTVLHPHSTIGPGAVLGEGCLVQAGVRIGARVEIGDRAIIHSNATVGADGFSFVTPQRGSVEAAKEGRNQVAAANHELIRIASLSTVLIGDDVEIGANTSIDRGTLQPTRIGAGTKIDNQVQIGHNVQIGRNCLICGRVGIAGSAKIGDRVVLGGASGVADHVTIGDDAIVMAMGGVAGTVRPGEVVVGIPALPRERAQQNLINTGRLKLYFEKINQMADRLDKLEQETRGD